MMYIISIAAIFLFSLSSAQAADKDNKKPEQSKGQVQKDPEVAAANARVAALMAGYKPLEPSQQRDIVLAAAKKFKDNLFPPYRTVYVIQEPYCFDVAALRIKGKGALWANSWFGEDLYRTLLEWRKLEADDIKKAAAAQKANSNNKSSK